MEEKLDCYAYRSLTEFTADITQIFENARMFNPKDSAIYQCADILEKQFRERIVEIKSAAETWTSGQKEVSLLKRLLKKLLSNEELKDTVGAVSF